MKHYYYSICSDEYLYKALMLYDSMKKYDRDFLFFIVCMEGQTVKRLKGMKLEGTMPIDVKDIEVEDKELSAIKDKRNNKTYAWAVKPCAAMYIFKEFNYVDHIIWLDSDTCFLAEPQAIYDEWKNYSIALTEEKFTGEYKHIADIYGVYNTGFMGFRNDVNAMEALKYFREKLIEWNYDEKEAYRWNDQLYVSDWPERFKNVGIIRNWGVNMTPFMLKRLVEEIGDNIVQGNRTIYVNDIDIVLYHFYGLSYYNMKEYELCKYTNIISAKAKKLIYLPYIKSCIDKLKQLRQIDDAYYKEKEVKKHNIRNYYIYRNKK